MRPEPKITIDSPFRGEASYTIPFKSVEYQSEIADRVAEIDRLRKELNERAYELLEQSSISIPTAWSIIVEEIDPRGIIVYRAYKKFDFKRE
jgi:hypothetical protein